MNNDFIVVFDITKTGYKAFAFAGGGLIFIAIGLLSIRFPNLLRVGKTKQSKNWFSMFFLTFSILWTIFAFGSIYSKYRTDIDALQQNRFNLAQGTVYDFRPMPYSGHSMEHFCVEKACFEYADGVITPAFNNTASHGGPIQRGKLIRVSYIGNDILKLEVARSSS